MRSWNLRAILGVILIAIVAPISVHVALGHSGQSGYFLSTNATDTTEAFLGIPTQRPEDNPIEVLNENNNYFLKVDLQDSRVRFRVALANNDAGGHQTLSGIKNRFSNQGYVQWAIINGDYFDYPAYNCPSNVNCAQGLTYIDGVRKDNWSQYGTTWPVRGNIGFTASNEVQIAVGDGQTKRHMVIAGGPWIVKDGGTPTCDAQYINGTTYFSTGEQFNGDQRWWCTDTRAITMVGYSENRRYAYMGISYGGKTVLQLGQWLKDRGAYDVLKLDSGGSSGMYFNESPILGSSRSIADALAVVVSNTAPPPACPTSGGVILYKDWQYQCGGEGEGSGWVRRESTGWQNAPSGFNDRASSVRVPSGWSVKLFEHGDRGGGWACRNSNDDNFSGDQFNNGVGLNDAVSSFEVFSDDHCGVNYAPNTPSLQRPSDGHVATDGRAPELCWNNSGDPDGDPLEFYAEVYGSAVNANSGWRSSTCWWPSSLDGQYYNYQWRVKARDNHGAESGWSTTWHFTIQPPNYPPTINFQTANGNGASQIISREQNWTFSGTASDPEGQLNRIEFWCNNCDGPGSGPNQTNGTNWSLAHTGMSGQNDVSFVAYDNLNQGTQSRHIDLRIDLAPPVTMVSLNNEANPANWLTWFTTPVDVRLQATDNPTGRAHSGVSQVRYRVDGGPWQPHNGSDVTYTVTPDGSHSVEYYAVDQVGNLETSRTVNLQIDQTPPNPPGGIVETHGVPNNVWQRTQNVATFTWAPSNDPMSGVLGYQFYFGPDPDGVSYQTFLVGDPRVWTPQPGGVRTGTYYLRGRTGDVARNWSAWADLFTFRYDGTPPENPSDVTHAAGIANDTWQRITNLADFAWPVPHDEGSGIQGYFAYWGMDPAGTGTTFLTTNNYQSPNPLCGSNDACTGYLRLRSQDNVSNLAEDWTTAFVLRFDNAPPEADFTFNGGVTQTTQTLVTLNLTASDDGSGVQEMRLSGDGTAWTPWEPYVDERPWVIPGISRQSWPVYLQVRDGVALESEVISHTIYLDVNPRQPRSDNFRLFDHALSAGSGAYTSNLYSGRGTLGQVHDSPHVTSTNYSLWTGYEAGARALPIQEPTHDEFRFVNGVFASGTGGTTSTSAQYRMVGTLGEPGLPNNETRLLSQNHVHQPGFLAASLPVVTPTPTPSPTPTPTPSPTPPPACESPTISINNGALFTHSTAVTLNLCASNAVEMKISNDGGFGGAVWEPYAENKAWTITSYGQYVLPRFVYAMYRMADGTIHGNYFDDIILDPNPPIGEMAVGEGQMLELATKNLRHTVADAGRGVAANHATDYATRNSDGSVDLYIVASDDNSGLSEMQIAASPVFTDTVWEPYSALKQWVPVGGDGIKTVYGRFRDSAGNISDVANTSFALDTLPPLGGIAVGPRIIGPDTVTTTVYLGAEDNLSGVEDMRVSLDPVFASAPWQPYTTTVTWPVSLTAQSVITLYAQYRDEAKNVSEVYTDTLLTDTYPPLVYVEVEPGTTPTRAVTILAYDGLAGQSAGAATMRLSNDPLWLDSVVTLPYTPTVSWTFDESQVVWVQVKDMVGNWSEPYPAYAPPFCDLAGGDDLITVADLQAEANRWQQSAGLPYDRDGDNRVTIVDVMWYAARWGGSCTQ